MIRIGLAVEGDTEVKFIEEVVAPQYIEQNYHFTPVDLEGNVSVDRLASKMHNLGHTFDAVTSLVDFYGFKKKGDRSAADLEKEVQDRLATRLGGHFDSRYVFPYVQVHEFEGLLFSDVAPFEQVFGYTGLAGELQAIRQECGSPEDINDSEQTAPSKRLAQLIPGYRKNLFGVRLASAMGLACIRTQCPRFDGWMTRIDRLAGV
ncbi:MAG: DUF4276 family protein [Caldilineaceae bacterium]|nr:DUF4276 family protein [Caldilineaceae bacterium]